jgi:hypothetical protein
MERSFVHVSADKVDTTEKTAVNLFPVKTFTNGKPA